MNVPFSLRENTSRFRHTLHAWFSRQLDDQKPKSTIAVLDGVRALACLLVVIYHSTGVVNGYSNILTIPAGEAVNLFLAKGVTLFFLLSGFLLFLPYAQSLLLEKPWPQARVFYLRRILRIVPGYYFALFALILLVKPFYLGFHGWPTLVMFLTFTMTNVQSGTLNPVFWTLAVEFQFYLLLPLLALGMYGLSRLFLPRWRAGVITGALLALIGWGLVTRFWAYSLLGRPDALAYLASHRLEKILLFLVYGNRLSDHGKCFEDFAVGMLLALCYVVIARTPHDGRYRQLLVRLSPCFWWCGLALLAFASARNIDVFFDAYPAWAIEFTFALGFGFCMLAVLFNGSGLLRRFFEWTPLRWIGLISFSMYLWHFPIITALEWTLAHDLFAFLPFPLALAVFALVDFVVVLIVSFTLYLMVEKPGMRLSDRLRRAMQTRSTSVISSTISEPALEVPLFDPEKTEPRQPVVFPTPQIP